MKHNDYCVLHYDTFFQNIERVGPLMSRDDAVRAAIADADEVDDTTIEVQFGAKGLGMGEFCPSGYFEDGEGVDLV